MFSINENRWSKWLIILLLLFNYSNSQNSPKTRKDHLWFLEESPWPAMPFSFGYRIRDLEGNQQYRKEISDGQKVTGSYGFWAPDGIFRHVDYIADELGFRANVRTSEPGVDNSNSADVGYSVFPLLYRGPPYLPDISAVNFPSYPLSSRNPYSLPPISGHNSRSTSAPGYSSSSSTGKEDFNRVHNLSSSTTFNHNNNNQSTINGVHSRDDEMYTGRGSRFENDKLQPRIYDLTSNYRNNLTWSNYEPKNYGQSMVYYAPEDDNNDRDLSLIQKRNHNYLPLNYHYFSNNGQDEGKTRLGLNVGQKELINGMISPFNPASVKKFTEKNMMNKKRRKKKKKMNNYNLFPIPPPSKTSAINHAAPYDNYANSNGNNGHNFGLYNSKRSTVFPSDQVITLNVDHDPQAKIDKVDRTVFDVPSGRPRISSSSGQGSSQDRTNHGNVHNSVRKSNYYPTSRSHHHRLNGSNKFDGAADFNRQANLSEFKSLQFANNQNSNKLSKQSLHSFTPENGAKKSVQFDDDEDDDDEDDDDVDTESSQSVGQDTISEYGLFELGSKNRPLMDDFVKRIASLYTDRMVYLKNRISLPKIGEERREEEEEKKKKKKKLEDNLSEINLPKVEDTLYEKSLYMKNKTEQTTDRKKLAENGLNWIASDKINSKLANFFGNLSNHNQRVDYVDKKASLSNETNDKKMGKDMILKAINLPKMENNLHNHNHNLSNSFSKRKWFSLDSRVDHLLGKNGKSIK